MGSPTDGYADRLRQRVRPSKGASRGLSQVASDSASNRMLVFSVTRRSRSDVSESVSQLLTLRTKLTDVTLVSEDTD